MQKDALRAEFMKNSLGLDGIADMRILRELMKETMGFEQEVQRNGWSRK